MGGTTPTIGRYKLFPGNKAIISNQKHAPLVQNECLTGCHIHGLLLWVPWLQIPANLEHADLRVGWTRPD